MEVRRYSKRVYQFPSNVFVNLVQGWLDAHLRGSKSSFSSYINGSTANFQEGLSMSVDKRDFTFTKELHEKLALNFFPIRSCLQIGECLCIQLNNLDKILMMFSCNVCVCMFLRQRKFSTYADNLMPGIVLEP